MNLFGSVLCCSRGAAALPRERLRQDHPALGRRRHVTASAPQRVRRVEGGGRPVRRDAGGGGAWNGDRRQRHRTGRPEHPAPRRGARGRPGARGRRRSTSARSSSGRAGARRSTLAARLAVFLASGESDGITGKLISAPWDPWEELPSHADDLRVTDVYTLRRIVPADRGLSWGVSVRRSAQNGRDPEHFARTSTAGWSSSPAAVRASVSRSRSALRDLGARIVLIADELDKLDVGRRSVGRRAVRRSRRSHATSAIPAAVRDAMASLRREHGVPDVLINNAGFAVYRAFEQSDADGDRTALRGQLRRAPALHEGGARRDDRQTAAGTSSISPRWRVCSP